jgi:hypothetical protein
MKELSQVLVIPGCGAFFILPQMWKFTGRWSSESLVLFPEMMALKQHLFKWLKFI